MSSSVVNNKNENDSYTSGSVEFHLFGSNSVIPKSPDIDAKGKMSIESWDFGSAGSLMLVEGIVNGDKFPSNETFMSDKHGNSIFLGVSGADGGPFTSLPGNNSRPMSKFSIIVDFNKDGVIQSVYNNSKSYSVEDWNKQFENLDPKSSDVSTDTETMSVEPKTE